ncbi:hypothetical protein H5410_002474 [Solanum commersonii]|uniref:Uncharacterized protein n=1 Tax=Solanum commersonii TaxID=4109 RepID=A0A9J6B1V3_SOLCO|nr:hypothetical protein H5410_002474 [Solanum commersonii]
MSPNDFGDSPFVCLIAISCLPSTPSHFGLLGGIVLLHETIRVSRTGTKGKVNPFGESPSVLGDAQTSASSAQINCVLKDSSCDTPLPEILMLAILATCASSISTKSI